MSEVLSLRKATLPAPKTAALSSVVLLAPKAIVAPLSGMKAPWCVPLPASAIVPVAASMTASFVVGALIVETPAPLLLMRKPFGKMPKLLAGPPKREPSAVKSNVP